MDTHDQDRPDDRPQHRSADHSANRPADPDGVESRDAVIPDSSPFPPPVIGDSTGAFPPAMATEQESRSKRPLIAIGTLGLAILLAVGGWIALRDRGGSAGTSATSSTSSGLEPLPTDPEPLYTVMLDRPVEQFRGAVGPPDLVVISVMVGDVEELRVFNRDGTELWRREVGDIANVQVVGDDVLIESQQLGETDHHLVLLAGKSGEQRWSNVVEWSDRVAVYDSSVLLFQYEPPTPTITAFDLTTGDKIAERQFDSIDPEPVSLSTTEGFVVWEAGEMVVVDARLEEVSARVTTADLGAPTALAVMGDEILAAQDRQLARYGLDGASIGTADFDIEEIYRLQGLGDSTWLFWTPDSCGAVRVSGERADLLWQHEGCVYNENQAVVLFEDADPLLLTITDDPEVLNAKTGETAHLVDGDFAIPASNGFVDWSLQNKTAFSWPGGEELFSIRSDEDQFSFMLNEGYVVVDESATDAIEVAIYG